MVQIDVRHRKRRPRYVFELEIKKPKESIGNIYWQPENWTGHINYDGGGFYWPQERAYLSKAAAERRAALYASWGCEVKIWRSEQVNWKNIVTTYYPVG